jgi:hypothetical protein
VKPASQPTPLHLEPCPTELQFLERCLATVSLRPIRSSPWATPFGPPRAKLVAPPISAQPPLPSAHPSRASTVPPMLVTWLCRRGAPPHRSGAHGQPSSGNLRLILHRSLVQGESLLLARWLYHSLGVEAHRNIDASLAYCRLHRGAI